MGRLRLAALAGAGLALLGSPLWGPPLLRQLPWFPVGRVEISGTRLVAPHQVLAASGIRRGQNLWEELAPVERAIGAHPAVAVASVSRRFPNTLRVRVEEKRPVAYVELEALSPVTALGELLPVDPARAWMDLPVIRGDWAAASPAYRLVILAETERLGRADPGLLARVSEIRGVGDDLDLLVLTHPLAEIVLPMGIGSARLAQLRAVLADLEGRLTPLGSPAAAAPAARVDLRFDGQVVVRLPSPV